MRLKYTINKQQFEPITDTQIVSTKITYFNSTINRIYFENDIIIPYYAYLFKQGDNYGAPDIIELANSIGYTRDEILNRRLDAINTLPNILESMDITNRHEVKEVFFTAQGAMYAIINDDRGNYTLIFKGKRGEWIAGEMDINSSGSRQLGFKPPPPIGNINVYTSDINSEFYIFNKVPDNIIKINQEDN